MPRQRFSRFQPNLQGTNDFLLVALCDSRSCIGIEAFQHSMQVIPAVTVGDRFQSIPPVLGPCRAIEQSLGYGAQIQAGTTGENRQRMPAADLFENLPRFTLI